MQKTVALHACSLYGKRKIIFRRLLTIHIYMANTREYRKWRAGNCYIGKGTEAGRQRPWEVTSPIVCCIEQGDVAFAQLLTPMGSYSRPYN